MLKRKKTCELLVEKRVKEKSFACTRKMAGGGTSVVGKKELSTLTLVRMTDETEFLVKDVYHWAEIVCLMENLREHPKHW